MKKTAFTLRKLSILKMPGFARGMESLEEMAANINIIYGTNGSGKSSTARVIQQLLWHNDTKGLSAEASAELADDNWEFKIDSDRIIIQRNGKEDELTGLPVAEGRHRYLLALHNLIEGKEEDLAKEIARESIGGFDLEAAKEQLGYSRKTAGRNSSEYKDFVEAEKKYKAAYASQSELKKQEKELSYLKEQKKNAEDAAKWCGFYDQCIEYAQKRNERTGLTLQFDAFPKSMEKLTGKEWEEINETEGKIREYDTEIERAEEGITACTSGLKGLRIPEDGIAESSITEMDERLRKLEEMEREVKDLEVKIAGFEAEEVEILKQLDDSLEPEEWSGLHLEEVQGLEKLMQEAHQLFGKKSFLLAEIQMLKAEADSLQGQTQNSDLYRLGIKTLSEWLKDSSGKAGIEQNIFTLLAVAAAITALLTFFVGWIGLLGLLLVLGIFVYGLSNKETSSSLQVRERDFAGFGLREPSSWTTEKVTQRVDELIKDLEAIKRSEKISQKLEDNGEQLQSLQKQEEKLEKRRAAWQEKIKSVPAFSEEEAEYGSLYWFLTLAKKWMDIFTQRRAAEAMRAKKKEQHVEELVQINSILETVHFEKVENFAKGNSRFSDLKKQESKRKDLISSLKQYRKEIQEKEKEKNFNEEKLKKLYEGVEVPFGDKEKIRSMIAQLEEYKELSSDLYSAQKSYSQLKRKLEEHFLFKEEANAADLEIGELQEKSAKNKAIAEKLVEIQEKITTIETLVQEKKKGHELEDLLAEKVEALDNLSQLYQQNLSTTTGAILMEELKKETQNENRPKIFRRANSIFNRITNGRYELDLNNQGSSGFRAFDTVLRLGQDLNQLSTGTRVQLLLSVRLAYVESVETSVKLPVLADELLANSDDERAKAIIEALVEISKEGRQVFYFTAQNDEVRKWQNYLDQTDLNFKVFNLSGEASEFYASESLGLNPADFTFIHEVPSAEGKTHAEYGDLIQVPHFDLLSQEVSGISLWYLIENLSLLQNCLSSGVKTWGQLESLLRNGGRIENLDEESYDGIKCLLDFVKRFQQSYRIGRSRPIDRQVLEESGCVSAAFLDAVVEKSVQLNNNPIALIQALRNGEVPRFRVSTTEELEQYFIENGFIDENEPKTAEEILFDMHVFLSTSAITKETAQKLMERLVGKDKEMSRK